MENKLNIISVPTGPLAVNTYIVWREGSFDCVVVDPAGAERVASELGRRGLDLKAILVTHGHFDHLLGVKKLKDTTGAKVYISKVDAPALKDARACLASMVGLSIDPVKPDVLLKDGSAFTEAGIDFSVISTPGHTKGGVCYVVESERVIFSGDTLFCMSYGRTDLPGGDSSALFDSIVYRLFALHGDYRVLPGHEGETTLDFERANNPCVRSGVCE